MFLEISEMKDVLYEYQMDEITENDDSIIEDGILAGIQEVRSYFEAANARRESAQLDAQQYAAWKLYDVDAIFNATGDERDKFILRLCKRVAAYNICELSNVDIIYTHVKERYENSIKTLEKIAGMGEYSDSRLIIYNLPTIIDDSAAEKKPFRMSSRTKFNHE